MVTQIRVSEDVQRALKAQAATEDKTQQQLADELLSQAIEERQDKKKKK